MYAPYSCVLVGAHGGQCVCVCRAPRSDDACVTSYMCGYVQVAASASQGVVCQPCDAKDAPPSPRQVPQVHARVHGRAHVTFVHFRTAALSSPAPSLSHLLHPRYFLHLNISLLKGVFYSICLLEVIVLLGWFIFLLLLLCFFHSHRDLDYGVCVRV